MSHDFINGTDSLVMNEKDDVSTVLRDVQVGESIHFIRRESIETLELLQSVPFGHKVAIVFIKQGAEILKYGEIIGKATTDIRAGEHVHVHNIEGTRGRGDITK